MNTIKINTFLGAPIGASSELLLRGRFLEGGVGDDGVLGLCRI